MKMKRKILNVFNFIKKKKIIWHFYHISTLILLIIILSKICENEKGLKVLYKCLQIVDLHIHAIYTMLWKMSTNIGIPL